MRGSERGSERWLWWIWSPLIRHISTGWSVFHSQQQHGIYVHAVEIFLGIPGHLTATGDVEKGMGDLGWEGKEKDRDRGEVGEGG